MPVVSYSLEKLAASNLGLQCYNATSYFCKMKAGKTLKLARWGLIIQTIGIIGAVARSWPFTKAMRLGENWQSPLLKLEEAPPVSIIVPARDEALNIERCLRSLLAQDYPDFEIVVVDDGSQDRTPQIVERLAAEDARLKIVRLDGRLPPGWAGKPHAMQAGVAAARSKSSWLLFTDADTRHNPSALLRAVSETLYGKADLFSVLSEIEMRSFWEKLLMPIAITGIGMQYPFDEVNAPDSKLAVANGQFLLLSRTLYDKVGGYAGKLRNSLLDDRDMALAVKAAGGRLMLRNGRDLLSVRMYRSFAEIWAGWRKNAFVGSRAAYLTVPLSILVCIFMGAMPFLQLPYALLKWTTSKGKQGKVLLSLSALQVVTTVYSRRRLDESLGLPFQYSVLNPLGMLVFAGILSDSMWRSLTGRGLSWKGRSYENAARSQQLI